ncbi:MAG TPA: ABC transporter substrate-binding protein [Chloroflexota bacterium]|jgi:NitT/TauT family transport system substrate-binding protein
MRAKLPFKLWRAAGWVLALAAVLLAGPMPRPTPAAAAPPTAGAGAASVASAAPAPAAPAAIMGAPDAQGLTTVKVGMQYLISDAGVLIADEYGYFRDVGIAIDPQRLDNPELQAGMASGQVDVGGIGPTGALVNAVLRGIRLRMVGDRGTLAPGYGYLALVARKGLVDSGQVRDVADLRGRKLAAQPPLYATPGYYVLFKMLENAGLREDDLEFVPLGFADQAAGLAGGTIDAFWGAEPAPTTVVGQGLGVRLRGGDEAVPNFDLGVLAYSEPFAAQTDLARRFMVAFLRGVRVYLDAFTRNVGRDRVVDLFTRQTALKDPTLYDRMVMPYMNPDGAFNTLAYQQVQEYYVRHGVVPQTIDMSQIVDNSFAEYAAQQLGPY